MSSARAEAWDRAALRSQARPYLDPLVAQAKRRAHLRLLEGWLPPLEGLALLKTDLWEEGVGGDELLFTLAERSGRAIGVDVSSRIVGAAAGRASALGADVELEQGDVLALPFDDERFDVVVSTSTIDHLEGAEQHRTAVGELRRVLAPGGTLVVTVDNTDNVGDPLMRLAAAAGAIPFPLGEAPTLEALRAMARGAGLDPREHAYVVPAPRVIATAAVRAARLAPRAASDRAVSALLRSFESAGERWPRRLGCFTAVRAIAR